MIQKTTLFLALLGLTLTWGQIAPLEPAKAHYKTLQKLSTKPNLNMQSWTRSAFQHQNIAAVV
ncbi:hypothetical protein [Flagellimonas sp.]|uniref:hypothetical protein n=1 Tax=Flagellimonas sp. TaxID=2058762 RepID=UPI003B51BBAE